MRTFNTPWKNRDSAICKSMGECRRHHFRRQTDTWKQYIIISFIYAVRKLSYSGVKRVAVPTGWGRRGWREKERIQLDQRAQFWMFSMQYWSIANGFCFLLSSLLENKKCTQFRAIGLYEGLIRKTISPQW